MQTDKLKINPAKKLKNGIGIISTGGPLSKERTEKAYSTLRSLDISFKAPYEPYKYYADYSHGFTNGSASERLVAITQALEDPSLDVLLAARGVTGSLDIISEFPFDSIRKERKLLIGQSDVTSLLVQTPFRSGVASIHGPTLGAEFADYHDSHDAKKSIDTLIKLISDPDFSYSIKGTSMHSSKGKEGRLIAGNLTMLVSLMGTPWDIDYHDRILVLEEVGEAPYRVQRLLTQLLLGGKFDSLSGLCFGRFSRCNASAGPDVLTVIDQFIDSKLGKKGFPILKNMPVGHWGESLPIPIGCRALINDEVLYILESPIN
jgi:muramoyltetrapeptide carboxypeptidase